MRSWLLAAIILLTGIAGGAKAAPPDGVELLRQAVTQEDHVAFYGTQETVLWSGDRADAYRARESHDGHGRVRVQKLQPRGVRGQLKLSDGKVEWDYDPRTRTAIRSADTPPEVEMDDLEPLLDNYEVKVATKPETVAGRRAWVVEVAPATDGKPHRRLWIDSATGVILKQERFHADDQPIDTSYFTKIRFEQPAPSLFAVRFPRGTRHRESARGVQPIKLGAVQSQFKVRVPEALPAGYEFESASMIDTKGKHGAHLRYRDGLSTISLFITPHSGAIPFGSRSGQKIPLRGGEGRLVRAHHMKTLAWRTPSVDCALVGDVSLPLLRTLAESTNLTQNAQESHHTSRPRFLWLLPGALFLLAAIIAIARRVSPRLRIAEKASW